VYLGQVVGQIMVCTATFQFVENWGRTESIAMVRLLVQMDATSLFVLRLIIS